MPVASMTGFARSEGAFDGATFFWEIRSVNGKGLELRFRLPSGFESLEPEIRRLASQRLHRGNLQFALAVTRGGERSRFVINESVLAEVLAFSDRLVAAGHAVTPTADGILAIRGVVEAQDANVAFEPSDDLKRAVLVAFGQALEALGDARETEGAATAATLRARLATMENLIRAAESDPARQPAAIRARLADQLAQLLDAGGGSLEESRLLGEVALLATRADIREELDRLGAHVAAAHKLLDDGGPIGRRLDFLSQEFNRESNTLCAKSNATSLTAIGLELKVAVDQFREQVQNVE